MPSSTKSIVSGVPGKLASAIARGLLAADDIELTGVYNPRRTGEWEGVPYLDEPDGVDVVVEAAPDDVVMDNLVRWRELGAHVVVGTSGFTQDRIAQVRQMWEGAETACLIVPNFSIGAVLMMRFAELAAPYFETGEIVEMHHDQKTDAPSGSAMLTAERMAAASSEWAPDPTTTNVVEGARGGEGPGGIRVHSVRMRGTVAHQEVVLGTTGQSLTIRHDSYDRASFMPGVLLAVRAVAERPGLTVGLDNLLGL